MFVLVYEKHCLYYGVFVERAPRGGLQSFFLFGFKMSKVDVVMGSQWGDEGKGKLVDTIGDRYVGHRNSSNE